MVHATISPSDRYYDPDVAHVCGAATRYTAHSFAAHLQGKYLYNDVSGPMWVGTIYPSSGEARTTKRVTAVCAANTPLPCLGDGMPAIGSIWSWGKDQYHNAYPLGNMGVFRLVNLGQCGIQC